MEQLAPEGVRLLAQQGTGWVLFLFACGACAWLLKKWMDAKAECFDLSTKYQVAERELHEKRLAEARDTVGVLHDGAKAAARLADSIEARTQTLQGVVTLVQNLEKSQDTMRPHWNGRLDAISKQLDDLNNRVEVFLRQPR
jgi:hypothetical protein